VLQTCLAAFAQGHHGGRLAPQFEAVYRPKNDSLIKSLQYASLAGTVAQRTLTGIVTGGVHLIYLPLILGCNAAAANSPDGGLKSAAEVCSTVVTNADALVQNSACYITDPTNQQLVLQRVVGIFIN
jgi:hypothetical protein